MEIDHVFMFCEPEGPEHESLLACGLTETYRRRHAGQGTANACFCFDNMYLELIWVSDAEEIRSPAVAPTGLAERALWASLGTCPFGIALRGFASFAHEVGPYWAYRAPFLPEGMSIAVAETAHGAREPMLFEAPGGTPPVEWPDSRRGELQHGAGLHRVTDLRLGYPAGLEPGEALRRVARGTGMTLMQREDAGWSLHMTARDRDGLPALSLALPPSAAG